LNSLVINCERDIKNSEELDLYLADHPAIETLLFVYWKWKVPDEMLADYRCIGFHTGPLLEGRGRGGSPIQNLKALGVRITTLCAFEMTSEWDKGRVLLAVPLSIEGNMREIWERIYQRLPDMVDYLTTPQPRIPEFFTREEALV
jgi:methionyl-tRNA formyltransferase